MSNILKSKSISTKSRPLGTRLKLFKIFRWLGLVVTLKLVVVGALLFDLPTTIMSASSLLSGHELAKTEQDALTAATGAQPAKQLFHVMREAQAAGLIGNNDTPANATANEQKCPDAVDPKLREALERRQSELDHRQEELNAMESRVNDKLEEMQALEGRIKMMLKDAQTLQDEKLRHLVDVYTNMKPKQAAQVLETLNEQTAVRILAAMRGRQAGEILTNVTPEKAAKLSEMLTKMQLPFE